MNINSFGIISSPLLPDEVCLPLPDFSSFDENQSLAEQLASPGRFGRFAPVRGADGSLRDLTAAEIAQLVRANFLARNPHSAEEKACLPRPDFSSIDENQSLAKQLADPGRFGRFAPVRGADGSLRDLKAAEIAQLVRANFQP